MGERAIDAEEESYHYQGVSVDTRSHFAKLNRRVYAPVRAYLSRCENMVFGISLS